jgi:2-polyprenyl-3-methyl-5-hydroxy-6-metoxy-1,4-benzoquinol methylase
MNQWFSDFKKFVLKYTKKCKVYCYNNLISLSSYNQRKQIKHLYKLLNTYPYNSKEHQNVEKRIAEVEARLGMRPPTDPANIAGWDRYWQYQINTREKPLGLTHYFEVTKPLMPMIQGLGYATVLSVGCGISLEVRGFAAGGLHAVGLDFSRVAIEYAAKCTLFETYQDQYLEPHEHQPHGHVEFLVGNFLDPTICLGPFDVIVSRGTIQYFHRLNMLDTALQSLVSRLSATGMLVIGTHGDIPAMEPITKWLTTHQFTVYFRENQQSFMCPRPNTRAAWHAMSTG